MATRRSFSGKMLLVGTALLALGACGADGNRNHGSLSYNYKLTVEVETPSGPRKGSSVIRSRGSSRIPGLEGLGGAGPEAQGEAVAVDLPDHKVLFALLRSENDVNWAGSVHLRQLSLDRDGYGSPDAFYDTVRSDRTVYPVQRWIKFPGNGPPRDDYPILVAFADIKDPINVQRVDPDDLEASFGAGYKLNSITVQVTDEPVTAGIEKRLRWLNDSAVMTNPGWRRLPLESRKAINGLFSGALGRSR